MAKPKRNDRCPCGSGKKYKSCCLMTDEAAEHERLRTAQKAREEQAAEKRQSLSEVRHALIAGLGPAAVDDDFQDDDPTEASNAVLDLIGAGKLEEAEALARDLLQRYPDIHDGWDRLGMVHEARGEQANAIECYRRVVAFLDDNPGYSEPAFKQSYIERIAKLEALPPPR